MYDLLVRGGQLVREGGVEQADLGVVEERIVEIAPELMGDAREELDARGLHVFPGAVDIHVHFNEPGRTDWEGIRTGSRALVAGGGTVFADMPLNSTPPVLDRTTFEAKQQAAERESYADFALWGGLTPRNLDRLPELAEAGAVGFKAFMSHSGLEEFESPDDFTLYEGMLQARDLGLIVALHAESDAITRGLSTRIRREGGTGVRDYLRSRPAIAEVEAVNRALLLAEETGAKLHLVHLSTGRAVTLAAEARARGVDVSIETCPHYLCFTGEDMERLGAVLKCAPPLRDASEVDALWQAIRAGHIDTIGSDHSPSTLDLKERADFFEVWGGIAGVQSTLTVLLTEGRERGLSLPDIARLSARTPAGHFGLAGKGRLEPGADADLVLVDLDREWVHTPEDLHTRWKFSPYLGRTFRGRVVQTRLRGQTVYAEGRFPHPPQGRFLRPAPAS
ncbi:dihydroorotase, multifunctional complex type (plasmid) [Deinococcus geothermalis DSM 11300]|uniref:Allantoinase n=1 Tax=Deinococcus geothermalis (strain DSM 11300 / CIP 105573 / AG-3a) TaxID=319795 RepID=ALLB_DEIGD|nr:allantoinase [Deinococcus geothermalis]Q1J391.1 RecName: Full=Allantoinase; AltName: Full=Allantoin-utilizing enzyme [Deinococcus geothermalis DSM 11300]ABF44043.1 dihydroorotase, multifunctional complex type [Deinococcus geothermalis DSM 11300]